MYDGAVQDLIDELGRLPGIGPKSAQRMAFHLLSADPSDVARLTAAIQAVKDKVRFCDVCGNVAEGERCRVCLDPRRDTHAICVVEEAKDVVAIERTREFRGLYHVLGGAISPMDGIGPAELRFTELMSRLASAEVTEVIVATDPNLEGEATASYLVRLLTSFEGLTVSRLASGLPVGGDLEYADEVTLGRAFEGRRVMSRARPATPPTSTTATPTTATPTTAASTTATPTTATPTTETPTTAASTTETPTTATPPQPTPLPAAEVAEAGEHTEPASPAYASSGSE